MNLNTVEIISELIKYSDVERGVIRNSNKKLIEGTQLLLKVLLDGGALLRKPVTHKHGDKSYSVLTVHHRGTRLEFTILLDREENPKYDEVKFKGLYFATGRFINTFYLAVLSDGIVSSHKSSEEPPCRVKPLYCINHLIGRPESSKLPTGYDDYEYIITFN